MVKALLFLSLFFTVFTATSALAINCGGRSDDRQCMICNCLHEAGDLSAEPFEGRVLVSQAVLQRKKTPRWNPKKKSECSVIFQPGQFVWTPRPKSKFTGEQISQCTKAVEEAYRRGPDGIESFRATKSRSAWGKLAFCKTVGGHGFYAERGNCPTNGRANASAVKKPASSKQPIAR